MTKATDKANKAKKISIAVEDKDAINELLRQINGRASSHTADASYVTFAAKFGEEELDKFGIPKDMRVGAEVSFMTAGPAKAYKYAVVGTAFTVIRKRSGWRLNSAARVSVYPGQREQRKLMVSEALAEEIKRRAVSDIFIKKAA